MIFTITFLGQKILEIVFCDIFSTMSTENGVGEKIKFQINNIPQSHSCVLFDNQYFIYLLGLEFMTQTNF